MDADVDVAPSNTSDPLTILAEALDEVPATKVWQLLRTITPDPVPIFEALDQITASS